MADAGGSTPSKRARDVTPEADDYGGQVLQGHHRLTYSFIWQSRRGVPNIDVFYRRRDIMWNMLGCFGVPIHRDPLSAYVRQGLSCWWQRNDTCPLCKTRATSGRHSFQLQAIVNHYDSKRPAHKRARADEAAAGQVDTGKAEIYPFGVAPAVAANQPNRDEDEDEELDDFIEDDEEDDEEDDVNLLVGGRIVFPCPACRPGHPSGYTCPTPIPEPTDAVKDSEAQDYLNGRRAIVEPPRGTRRVQFAEGLHNAPGAEHLFTAELKAEIDRACEEHIACHRCTSYLPRNWPGRAQSICKGCGNATCEAFDPIGCPWAIVNPFLTPFNEAGNALHHGMFWEQVSGTYPQFFSNPTERQRFLDRLANNNITPSSATQELLREAGHGDADYFCSVCIESTVRNGFAESWRRKKENGEVPLPAQAANLPDCWYGRECRTQGHNAGHAARLNHDCDPRPAGQAQQAPPAPDPAPAPAPAVQAPDQFPPIPAQPQD